MVSCIFTNKSHTVPVLDWSISIMSNEGCEWRGFPAHYSHTCHHSYNFLRKGYKGKFVNAFIWKNSLSSLPFDQWFGCVENSKLKKASHRILKALLYYLKLIIKQTKHKQCFWFWFLWTQLSFLSPLWNILMSLNLWNSEGA